jgi:hypothetical protein
MPEYYTIRLVEFKDHDYGILNLLVLLVWRLCFILRVMVFVMKKFNNKPAGQHTCKKEKMSLCKP